MIDTAALRSKIIDLAIQGKLTEQLPTDGTAEELYQQIQTEKVKLIKEKKIKKEKPLPEITVDEIPFDIPDNWKWVRLRDIVQIINGDRGKNYPAKSTLSHEGIPFISALNLNGDGITEDDRLLCLTDEQYNRLGSGKLERNDIVICIRGSIGKHGRYPYDKGAIASSLVICRPYVYLDEVGCFIMKWLKSYLFVNEIGKYDGGSAQPNLAADNLKKFLVPLPPLAEQKRIVAKIEEVLAEIKTIDELQSKYASNVDVLKSKIIDAGIRGQLTEQLPEDGTAEELYKAIQAEKAQLIKDKKIKKEKPLPEITADEIPFDVPDNWKWVRIGDVVKYSLGGGTPSKNISEYWKGGDIPWASVKDFSAAEAGYLNDTIDHITQDGLNNSASNMVDENAIVICMRMALGKAVRFLRPMAINQDLRAIWLHDCVDQSYFMYMYSTIKVEGRGTTVAGIRKDELMSFLFPLPPLSEQKRIVAKIDEVFNALDERDCL